MKDNINGEDLKNLKCVDDGFKIRTNKQNHAMTPTNTKES